MMESCFHKFTGQHYWSRSPALTFFFKKTFFFFFRKPSLQRSWNCLLLTTVLFLVFDRTPLLYSLSEPATNRNSEEQLSGIYLRKKCIGKVPFQSSHKMFHESKQFYFKQSVHLLLSLINVTGVIFNFITQQQQRGDEVTDALFGTNAFGTNALVKN